MSHAVGARRTRRRDELRGQLLDAVEGMLVAGEPYGSITVDRLVAEAGVSRSSFYVYFEDKSDLLSGRFLEIADAVHDAAATWWALDAAVTERSLRDALTKVFDTYWPHMQLMMATHDLAATDAGFAELVAAEMQRSIDGLAAHIVRGQAEGFIDPALPAQATAGWLWMSEPGFHQIVKQAGTVAKARRDAIESFTAVVWNALYRPVA
jgi:AcrR family transcriptional regulator